MLEMGRQERLLFGTMLVAGAYAPDNYKTDASVIGGTVARVVAEQIAMYVAIMLATTSAAAAASSSN